jgi:hypothetical protein
MTLKNWTTTRNESWWKNSAPKFDTRVRASDVTDFNTGLVVPAPRSEAMIFGKIDGAGIVQPLVGMCMDSSKFIDRIFTTFTF